MNKGAVIIVALMFALALGAGVVAGKLSARGPVAPTTVDTGTLSDELKLSPEQQKQMQEIWEHMQGVSNKCLDDARKVQSDQDEALKAILTPEQLKKWSEITTQNFNNIAVLESKRKEALKDAIRRTNELLNKSQREIYKQLLKDRLPGAELPPISQNFERQRSFATPEPL